MFVARLSIMSNRKLESIKLCIYSDGRIFSLCVCCQFKRKNTSETIPRAISPLKKGLGRYLDHFTP